MVHDQMHIGTKCILGPVLSDLDDIGLSGRQVIIATAFYTRRPLERLSVQAERLTLLVRLDVESVEDWARGCIAPDALIPFVERPQMATRLAGALLARYLFWGLHETRSLTEIQLCEEGI
jgi:hypothetical protein